MDLVELSYRAVSYEALIREENQRHTSSQGTYYYDPNLTMKWIWMLQR